MKQPLSVKQGRERLFYVDEGKCDPMRVLCGLLVLTAVLCAVLPRTSRAATDKSAGSAAVLVYEQQAEE